MMMMMMMRMIYYGWWRLLQNATVEKAVRCYGDRDVTWSSQGMLRLSPRAMRKMFEPTLDHIKQLIGNVLNEPLLKGNSKPLNQRIICLTRTPPRRFLFGSGVRIRM